MSTAPTRKETSSSFINESYLQDRCALNKALKIVGKKWMAEVLLHIEKDAAHFTAIKDSLEGITDHVLASSLNLLVHEGIIDKDIVEKVPLKVAYTLTHKGLALMHILHQLCAWERNDH